MSCRNIDSVKELNHQAYVSYVLVGWIMSSENLQMVGSLFIERFRLKLAQYGNETVYRFVM